MRTVDCQKDSYVKSLLSNLAATRTWGQSIPLFRAKGGLEEWAKPSQVWPLQHSLEPLAQLVEQPDPKELRQILRYNVHNSWAPGSQCANVLSWIAQPLKVWIYIHTGPA